MKTNFILGSLCLTPLVLAVPISRATSLAAGRAFWNPARQAPPPVLPEEQETEPWGESTQASLTSEDTSSPVADSERPKTTHELLDLAKLWSVTTSPSQSKSSKSNAAGTKAGSKVISVGTLVEPNRAGARADAFDPDNSPYLIPGQYVARQRPSPLIVGLIFACVLVVVVMESWELVVSFVTSPFKREGAIQLPASGPLDLEAYCEEEMDIEDDDDDDDDSDVPFGGYGHINTSLLPGKVDEKTTWL